MFEVFFKGAIESKGAFIIYDAKTNAVIGSTRYYDFDSEKRTVNIGYTFFSCSHWSSTYNPATKKNNVGARF